MQYAAGLADYQVKRLDSVSGGGATLRSVTPSEWINNDPFAPGNTNTIDSVVKDYSGGYKVSSGTTLYATGGGHSAAANNGIYPYDFFGTSAPYGFRTPVGQSAVADVISSSTYADGSPPSIHSYDVCAVLGGYFYRERGSRYNDGGNPLFWRKPLAGGAWQSLASNPNVSDGYTNRGSLLPDESSGKLYSFVDNYDQGFFYRPATNNWSSGNPLGFSFGPGGSYPTSCRGPGNECVVLGGTLREKIVIDFSAETIATTDLTTSGSDSILNSGGLSVVYDPTRGHYWAWGGGDGSSGWSNIYEINRSTWAVTAHALTGDAIDVVTGLIGSWARFVFMDSYRLIGLFNTTTAGACVIKLPS